MQFYLLTLQFLESFNTCLALSFKLWHFFWRNWGLIGFFNFNLVAFLFGSMTWISRIIYALVGLCGLYLISFYMKTGEVEA